MMYKTSSPDHKPSIGILVDLIRAHGVNSEQVAAYLDKWADNETFMKRASLLISIGKRADAIKNQTFEKTETPPAA